MRLAVAEEIADPGTALAGPARRGTSGGSVVRISPLAHEGREFAAQLPYRLLVLAIGNPGMPHIDEGVRRRIALEDILDLRPCSSGRRDQYGKIVPAIACVQNAVVVSFVLTRKENDKASADIILNHAEDPRDTRKAEECARAKGRNDGDFRKGLDGRHGHAPIPAGPRRTVSSSTMSPAIRRSIRPSRFASRTKQLLRGIAIDQPQPRRDEDAATACGAGEPEGEGGSRGGRP